ncbi:MAG: winged helix-turn-helix transcriptional regulator [Candidatus Zambryskibacteria bacterium]
MFVPAPRLNQYNLLRQIANDHNVTQAELASLTGLSVAMVNSYMKKMRDLGLLEYDRKSYKTINYSVTLMGHKFIRKMAGRLVAEITAMTKSLGEIVASPP